MKNFNNFTNLMNGVLKKGPSGEVKRTRLEKGSNEHPMSIHSASIEHPLGSGGNQVETSIKPCIWKYAAMMALLLALACGQAWGDVTLTVSETSSSVWSETFADGSVLYSIDSNGRSNADNHTNNFKSTDIISGGSKTTGAALQDQRFAIKFPVAVSAVTFYGYSSSSGRSISKVYTSTTMAKSSYTEITSSTTKNVSSTTPNYSYTFTASWASPIDANTAIWFQLSNSCNIYKIVYTPASTPRTFKSGETIYFKDQESNFDFDALWKVPSGNVYAYFWNDTENGWSSYGTPVDQDWNEANAIYEITVPGSGKEYTKVLFTRGNGADFSNTWDKTEDQTPAVGKNLFYVYKTKYADHIYKGAWGNFTPASKTIYFDARIAPDTWTTAYVRIGHGSSNSAWGAMTKVAGTKCLYTQTTSKWISHSDFAIANKAGWTGDNHIDQPEKTYSNGSWSGSEHKMTMQTNYQQYAIDSNTYICPKATSVLEHECQFYQITDANSTTSSRIDANTKGMRLPQYKVVSSATNCSVAMVQYTKDDFSTSSDLSSGSNVDPTRYVGVTVTPNSGYEFSSVTLTENAYDEHTAAASGVTGKYAILANCTITAECTPITYSITYKDGGNTAFTGVHIGTQPTEHTYATATALKKASKAGYVFGGWYTDSKCTSSAGESLGATAYTADITLYAKWTAISMVDLVSGTFYGASAMVPADVTVGGSEQAYPGVSSDQRFNMLGTSTSDAMASKTMSSLSLTNASAVTEYLDFKGSASVSSYIPSTKAVQFKIPAAGQLEVWANSGIYLSNGSSETSISPSSNYAIVTVAAGTYYLYAQNTSRKLYGIRYKKTHSVSAVTSTGTTTYGTVSASPTTVAEDSASIITAVPATGYQVTNWAKTSGTGASISPSGSSNSNTTTLTMGTTDATVTVTFGAINYSVTYSSPSNGDYTIKVGDGSATSATKTANYGNTITLAATPEEGYEFSAWTITNTSTSADVTASVSLSDANDKDATFTMPAYGVTVTATFAALCTDPSASLSDGAYTIGGSALNLRTLWSSSNTTDGVTFTVTDANGTGATIAGDGYSFSATTAGTATISASQTSTGDYCDVAATSATITVSNPTYTVTYTTTGSTSGSAPTDSNSPYESGSTVTVLGNTGSLAKTDNVFLGWSDGVNAYAPGETFTISANTTLSPIWKEGTSATVTYTMAVGADYTWSASGSSNETTGIPNAGVTITETYAGIDSGKGHKKGSTAKLAIQTTAQGATYENPTNYILYNFFVASGYAFTPSDITIKIANVGAASANNIKYKAVLSDGSSHSISTTYICTTQDATIETFHLYNEEGVTFDGSVSLKLWAWTITDITDGGSAYRLGTPLTIAGVTESTATLYDISTSATNGTIAVTVGGESASSAEEDATVTITATPSDGYSFSSWTVTDEDEGSVTVTSATTNPTTFTMPAKAVTVSATFSEITHTVSVAAGAHGTVSPSSVSGVGIATASGDITATPSTGYNFSSWDLPSGVTAAAGKTASSNPIQINATADDKTITATWTTVSYTISYTLNGGDDLVSPKTNYNIETDDYDLPTPTRDGYVFQGWYTASDFSGDRVYTLAQGSTGNKYYYAKWGSAVTATWSETANAASSSKFYAGSNGHTVTVYLDQADWDTNGNKDDLVLTASDGVTLSNITKSINGDGKAQVSATFAIDGSVDGDITFALSVPATSSYSAVELEETLSLDDCPGGSTTVTLTNFGANKGNSSNKPSSLSKYFWSYAGTTMTSAYAYTITTGNTGTQCGNGGKDSTYMTLKYGSSSNNGFMDIYADNTRTEGTPSTFSNVTAISLKIKAKKSNPTLTITIGGTSVASAVTLEDLNTSTYTTYTYNNLSNLSGAIRIQNNGSTADYDLYLDDIAITYSGTGGVATSLAWSSSLADKATVNKNDVDPDFQYYASPTPSNAGGPINYTSSNTSVATVSSNGTVHIVNSGTTTITASMPAYGCYNAATSITYSLVVANTCEDEPGTISAGDPTCSGIKLTVDGHTKTASTQYQWYRVGSPDETVGTDQDNYTATTAGTYYVKVNNTASGGCTLVSTNKVTMKDASTVDPTIFADEFTVKQDHWFGYRLMEINNGESVSVKTAPTGWVEDLDFKITTKNNIVSIEGNVKRSTGDKTLTLTVANECGATTDEGFTIHEIAAPAKPTVAWIATGDTKGEKTCKASESTNTGLYKYLEDYYTMTAINCYWSTSEADLVKEYSKYDLVILTDYPNSGTCPTGKSGKSNSYTNAIGQLIDHRPIMTFEAFVAGCPNWGIPTNPSNTKSTQASMTLLCNAGEIFGDESGIFAAGKDIAVTEASSGQALQGFPVASLPDYVFIGKITDSDDKEYVACCERQVETGARTLIFGLNSALMSNLTDNGKLMVQKFADYLLETDPASIPDCSVIFNGGGADDSWYTTDNWEGGSLPDEYASVRLDVPCEVPSNASPAKAGSIKIHQGGAFTGSLTIKPAGCMIVEKGITRVEGDEYTVHKRTQPSDVVIEANATNQGALIFNNESTRTQATVQMYSKAHYDEQDLWQYVAVPLVSASRWNMGDWAFKYDNASQGWSYYEETYYAFDGIGLTQDDAATYEFEGELASTTPKTIPLYPGNNMVGNSWTAPIHIVNFDEDKDFGSATATVFIYETGHDPDGGATNTDGNTSTPTAGKWHSIPIASARTAIAAGTWNGMTVIPAMQAFEVKTTSNTSLTLNYDQLVRDLPTSADTNEPLHAPRKGKSVNTTIPQMRITMSDGKARNDVYLFSGERFSEGFDNGWDGEFMKGESRYAQLYAITPNGNLAISAQPEMEGTVLGFAAGVSEEYTMTFRYIGDETLYLNDMSTQTSTLIDDESEYTFTALTGEQSSRFVISSIPFEAPQIPTGITNLDAEAPKVRKVLINDMIYIIRGGKIYSIDGAMVK